VGGPIRSGEFGRELDVENGDLAGEELIAGLAAGLGLDSTSALLRSASLDFFHFLAEMSFTAFRDCPHSSFLLAGITTSVANTNKWMSRRRDETSSTDRVGPMSHRSK
jgi:hypothetical protein